MIKTKLPILETNIDEENKKIIKVEKDIEVFVDTSLFAEERWEANFPINAKNETLFAYLERISAADLVHDKAYLLSNMKAFYCFLESKELPSFKDFCLLFDGANSDYVKKLIDKMEFVFNLVLKSSATNSKN